MPTPYAWHCRQCDGRLVVSKTFRRDGRRMVRYRVCKECGDKETTTEVTMERYQFLVEAERLIDRLKRHWIRDTGSS